MSFSLLVTLTAHYGNFMFLQAFNTPIVVISSPDICRDLMEKRSAIYSDKARFAIDELTGWDFNLESCLRSTLARRSHLFPPVFQFSRNTELSCKTNRTSPRVSTALS
ncbi:hypothetical protein BC629DRAFT_772756 [Irpex lacteus]|nr:hypothetical protein BC629DRAFT_772756 [Irpex lacteus]